MDNIGLFVVIALAVIFVTPYLYMQISAVRSVGKHVPISNLITATEADPEQAVYIYFMSTSCSMCKSMTPIIEKLMEENPNILLIDIHQHPEQIKDLPVYGTPTLMSIHDGIINKVKLGKLSANKINQFMAD